tara:strand:+ start:613 stop:1041 length:429 start_codon:yes stop_codon:yes gene_type:complete
MENFLIQNISIGTTEFAMLIMIISFLLILIAFFNNQKGIKSKLDKLEQNLSKINNLINEMNSGYGTLDKNLSSSKEDLININETILSIQKDIGKKSDENLSEQNINKAVDLAKLGVDIKEISSKTGLSEEQIETLIKFHTEK